MTDGTIAQIATAGIALLGTMFSGVMAYLMAKLNSEQTQRAKDQGDAAAAAAEKVEEVKVALEESRHQVAELNKQQTIRMNETAAKVAEVRKVLETSTQQVMDANDAQSIRSEAAAIKVQEVKRTLDASMASGAAGIAQLAQVTEARSQEAALKVEEVRQSLETNNEIGNNKLDKLAKVAEATHALVNNNMAVQLRLNALVTRRLANLTNLEIDIEEANAAEKLYLEHIEKQKIVDSQHGTDEEKTGKH
jgi:hypothetical protein